ncbi:unnamed protein product, partial [Staurois parvus]
MPPVSAHQCHKPVPVISTGQCHLSVPYECCLLVPISDACQCPQVM